MALMRVTPLRCSTASSSRAVASRGLGGAKLVVHRGERAIVMVLDRQHVAREAGGSIARRLLLLGLQPAADILRLRRGIERLRLGLLELALELGDPVMLRDLGRPLGRLLADFLRFLVQMLFVFRGVVHAINLVRAFAVKSTMGTTRA